MTGLTQQRQRRVARVRSKIQGTATRPRLSVAISNRNVTAQLIDDVGQKTLALSSSLQSKVAAGPLSAKAVWVGQDIAKQAKARKIGRVIFDRHGRRYHGRIKALAEAARKGGLEI